MDSQLQSERVQNAVLIADSPPAAVRIPQALQQALDRWNGMRSWSSSPRRTHGLTLLKNCATAPKCVSMSGSRPHSAAISENGPNHEAGGGMSAGGIPCVFRRWKVS